MTNVLHCSHLFREQRPVLLTQSSTWSFPPLSHVMSGSGTDQNRKGQDPGRQSPRKTNIKLWERLSETIKAEKKHTNTVKESLVYRATPYGARKRGNQHSLLGIRRTQKKVQSYQK